MRVPPQIDPGKSGFPLYLRRARVGMAQRILPKRRGVWYHGVLNEGKNADEGKQSF
jgi:hypothetical protein